jgi:hypothetical protein
MMIMIAFAGNKQFERRAVEGERGEHWTVILTVDGTLFFLL